MSERQKAQAQLIEDLLDVSRIESGRLRLDLQAVDLVEVVKTAGEAMRVAADAKSITLAGNRRSSRQSNRGRSTTPAAGSLEPGLERGEIHSAGRQDSSQPRKN